MVNVRPCRARGKARINKERLVRYSVWAGAYVLVWTAAIIDHRIIRPVVSPARITVVEGPNTQFEGST